ncbi:helix-turn-helix domain-containing protein [Streptomyces noursei]|uniref:helix-turn-helix domain-containing protein n=1 Tax=Streptomyces noursei TaxID=1971 RepID=UPI000A6466BF|nr:helix-turn-helix transcriptional regulator [Streptomyces noursei]
MFAVRKSTEEEPDPVARMSRASSAAAGRLLGEMMRAMRIRRGLTLKEVAPIIRASVSKISRMERGESPPKFHDVMDLARHYGADTSELSELDVLYRQTAHNDEWHEQYADVTPDYFRRLISLEGQAKRIITYENQVVPGLLQEPAYAEVLLRAALPDHPEDKIQRRIKLRVERQVILRHPVPEVVALIDEGVLRRPVGGLQVMCNQLDFLLEVAKQPTVSIHVVPFVAAALHSPPYPITHLQFDDGGPAELIYVEALKSANYVTRPNEIKEHRLVLERLMQATEDWSASLEVIRKARDDYFAQL